MKIQLNKHCFEWRLFLLQSLICFVAILQSHADGEVTNISFPISSWIDEAPVQTALRITLPVLSINTPMEKWLSAKHALPEDKTLSELLSSIVERNSGKVASLVWEENFKVTDANEFTETMRSVLCREGYVVQILGKTVTDTGVVYCLGFLGPKPSTIPVKLRLVDPLEKTYKWEVVASNSSSEILQQNFKCGDAGALVQSGSTQDFHPGDLANVFGGAISVGGQSLDKVRECVAKISSSQMSEGITEGSKGRIAEQMSSLEGDLKQKYIEDFKEMYRDPLFVIDASPVVIAFFRNKRGFDHATFVKSGSEYLLTNYYRVTPIDNYLSSEFVKANAFNRLIENLKIPLGPKADL